MQCVQSCVLPPSRSSAAKDFPSGTGAAAFCEPQQSVQPRTHGWRFLLNGTSHIENQLQHIPFSKVHHLHRFHYGATGRNTIDFSGSWLVCVRILSHRCCVRKILCALSLAWEWQTRTHRWCRSQLRPCQSQVDVHDDLSDGCHGNNTGAHHYQRHVDIMLKYFPLPRRQTMLPKVIPGTRNTLDHWKFMGEGLCFRYA